MEACVQDMRAKDWLDLGITDLFKGPADNLAWQVEQWEPGSESCGFRR